MFSQEITESDSFLDMPLSAQALYFHLGMSADDDGFVNSPKRVQRSIGANEDDLKLLIAKHFVLAFDSGVVVIKHWKINNYIAKDRYKPTTYIDEKSLLVEKENRAYTFCIQDVYNCATQTRLDKTRLDKDVVKGGYDFNEMLSADEIHTLYSTYEDANDLIEQVQAEVNAKGLIIKASAFAYIMGYAKNKGWMTK
jgi:hypothetical protein